MWQNNRLGRRQEMSLSFLNSVDTFRNWNMGVSLWTPANTFSLLRGLSSGTGCQEKLWSLPAWRSSKATWTWSWSTCFGCPCLSKGLDQMASKGPIQPQPFCEPVKFLSRGVHSAAGIQRCGVFKLISYHKSQGDPGCFLFSFSMQALLESFFCLLLFTLCYLKLKIC